VTKVLRDLLQALRYRVRIVLTDTGIQVTDRAHPDNGIERRLMKVKHPWTRGEVERSRRPLSNAFTKATTFSLSKIL
jgi:transposase InsO family protein